MKLKTLKDIAHYKTADGRVCEGFIPDVQELKAEAIKWVKEDLKDIKKIKNGLVKQELIILEYEWMKRLDIKEEDLK